MRRRILFPWVLLIGLSLPCPACAESVQGIVVHADSGERVPYCRVYIGDNRALADDHGNFVMLLDPGDYPVRVEGYATSRINDRPQDRLRVLPGQRQRAEIAVSRH